VILAGLVLGVLLLGMGAWYVVQARRKKALAQLVTDRWLNEHSYDKDGDRE
jgi:hypothetical protein